MSVVNQMLRDLEKNQSSVNQLPLQAVSSGYKPVKIIAWLLILVSLVASLFYFSQLADETLSKKQVLSHETNPVVQNSKGVEPSKLIDSTTESKPTPTVNINSTESQKIASSSTHLSESLLNSTKSNNASTTTLVTSTSDSNIQNSALSNLALNEQSQVNTNNTQAGTSNQKHAKHVAHNNTKRAKAESEPLQQAAPKQAMQTKQPIKQQSQQTQLNNQLQRIQLYASNSSPSQTYGELNQLLQQNPDFHPARIALIYHMLKHSSPQTSQILAQARKLYPQQTSYLLAQAQYLIQYKQFAQLEAELADLDPNDINYAQLLQLRAVAKQKQNKHKLAIQDYINLIQLSGEKGALFIALGLSFDAIGDSQQALLSYQKALNDQNLNSRQRQFLQAKIASYQHTSQG
jgi:MSHA biogenesis protein MshN